MLAAASATVLTLSPTAFAQQQGTALAQNAVRAALPDTTPCPESVAAIATCYTARHETGAYLFAFMPKDWNGNLVVFAHGGPYYTPPTATDRPTRFDNLGSVAVRRGFTWIGSTYRREGFGILMAAEDSDDARKFFITHFATPRRTVLLGSSYGGLVGAKLVETYSKNPDGSSRCSARLWRRCKLLVPQRK
jgi:pimeloyl-ACP methyl ester carboxylesterase